MEGRVEVRQRGRRSGRRTRLSRLQVTNAAIVVAIVYIFAGATSYFASQLALDRHGRENRGALGALCQELERKHDEFISIIFGLYDGDNYDTVSTLLEAPSDDGLLASPSFRRRVVGMIEPLTSRDDDIAAVLLYKTLTGTPYVYNSRFHAFEMAPADYPFLGLLKDKPPGRLTYGVQSWTGATKSTVRMYGIATSLGTRGILWNAGHVVVAYDCAALRRAFQRVTGSGRGRFLLLTEAGETIFDSYGQYGEQPLPFASALVDHASSVVIGGVAYHALLDSRPVRRYLGVHLEPRSARARIVAGNWLLIYGICTVFAALAVLLYARAGREVSRRVRELQRAMDAIGSHNLDHRIALEGREDELTRIAASFNRMCDELQVNIDKLYVNELKQKAAELNALQAGINPHFLYNTLQAICSKAREDGNREVAELLVFLSNLMRNIVRSRPFVSIRQELEFCRLYMELFVLRYGDRFRYEMAVDPEIGDYGIPKNVLQPVLENYFIHGFREDASDNLERIEAHRQGGMIVFRFQDNGIGMSAERLEEVRARLAAGGSSDDVFSGLANVNERIRIVFGAECGLSVHSEPGEGTTVEIRIRAMGCEEIRSLMEPARLTDGEST